MCGSCYWAGGYWVSLKFYAPNMNESKQLRVLVWVDSSHDFPSQEEIQARYENGDFWTDQESGELRGGLFSDAQPGSFPLSKEVEYYVNALDE
jgi:hypothetical protein